MNTNVFIHALSHDAHSEECLRLLEGVQQGKVRVQLEPLVLHELSYALPHYRREMTRSQVAEYLLAVLAWDGVTGEKGLMVDAVERWRDTSRLAFVDAYLEALAVREARPIYTKNVRELLGPGPQVADPLPGTD